MHGTRAIEIWVDTAESSSEQAHTVLQLLFGGCTSWNPCYENGSAYAFTLFGLALADWSFRSFVWLVTIITPSSILAHIIYALLFLTPTIPTNRIADETECCPPQTASAPIRKGHAHPLSESTGVQLAGKIVKSGAFDEVYEVRRFSGVWADKI